MHRLALWTGRTAAERLPCSSPRVGSCVAGRSLRAAAAAVRMRRSAGSVHSRRSTSGAAHPHSLLSSYALDAQPPCAIHGRRQMGCIMTASTSAHSGDRTLPLAAAAARWLLLISRAEEATRPIPCPATAATVLRRPQAQSLARQGWILSGECARCSHAPAARAGCSTSTRETTTTLLTTDATAPSARCFSTTRPDFT